MQLDNEFTVPAPVSEVWKTLLDVERIAPCMPGATVDRVDGDEVAGRVRVILGMFLGQRRRIVIMTAPVPPGTVPPKRAML